MKRNGRLRWDGMVMVSPFFFWGEVRRSDRQTALPIDTWPHGPLTPACPCRSGGRRAKKKNKDASTDPARLWKTFNQAHYSDLESVWRLLYIFFSSASNPSHA